MSKWSDNNMGKDFYSAVADRRTFYGISKEVSISDDKIKEVIEHAVKYTPSAFNSQSTKVVVLLGEQHDKLWNITMENLRRIVPAENFSSTEQKINSFKNGYGTILFFDDVSITSALQEKFPLYKNNFPVWAQQSNGMNQFVIWTALESEGLGVSLQHYNEVIEKDVKKQWNIPENWKMAAQMPFGKPIANPGEKEFVPLKERIKIYK